MAELDVGKQCSVLSCKQLDFLPFICKDCSLIFCLEHRSTTSHNCSGESRRQREDRPHSDSYGQESATVKCSVDGCNVRQLIPIKCVFCENVFCLGHRHQQAHLCPKQEEISSKSTTKDGSQQALVRRKEKTGRGGAKCSSRAAKVALMKMKLHAQGEASTPQVERVYFTIILPAESSDESKPMFFSKFSVIRRIMVAEVCAICLSQRLGKIKQTVAWIILKNRIKIDGANEEEYTKNELNQTIVNRRDGWETHQNFKVTHYRRFCQRLCRNLVLSRHKWTVGRAVDQVAKICKLKNQNNRQSSKKLRLFDGLSWRPLTVGNSLEEEMAEHPETLVNGSELILEYVEES